MRRWIGAHVFQRPARGEREMGVEQDPIVVSHIWKQYRIGSKHDSLRDAIPAMFRQWVGGNGQPRSDGAFWALRDVSFTVRRGEMLGIIGPNGAGKSTMLKVLSRISTQTTGDLRVRGRLAALIEVGAGFHTDLTGRENIYLNGTIMGLRKKQIDRLFDSIVAFSELEQFLETPIKRYSSGMVVRLGFSIAAHIQPDNLLVDEVLAVGDLAFQRKCYQRILDLKAQGTTILFISHNLEAVQRLCDRVLLLRGGEIYREGDPGEMVRCYREEVLRAHRPQVKSLDGQRVVASSLDVPLVTVRVVNAEGELQEGVETGEFVRIQLGFAPKRPIRQPSVTVTLERLDGLICHETSTHLSGLAWAQWDSEQTLILDYPELNLLPNTYQVAVTVHEGQNPAPLLRFRDQVYFHVTSQQQGRGTVHLEHTWSQDGAPADGE